MSSDDTIVLNSSVDSVVTESVTQPRVANDINVTWQLKVRVRDFMKIPIEELHSLLVANDVVNICY